jgi:hypothetical protein
MFSPTLRRDLIISFAAWAIHPDKEMWAALCGSYGAALL